MNKQQLAAKIWESANQMRSKIEANEYKDYILGFIFYKFLSDKEEAFLRQEGWTDEYLKDLTEEDTDTVEHCQRNLGFFIGYKHLFSTWLSNGRDFDAGDVSIALSAFSRLMEDIILCFCNAKCNSSGVHDFARTSSCLTLQTENMKRCSIA